MIKWGKHSRKNVCPCDTKKDMAEQLEKLRRLTLPPARATEEEAELKAARAAEEREAKRERERATQSEPYNMPFDRDPYSPESAQ